MAAVESASPSMLPAALWWTRMGHPVFPLWWPIDGACACPRGPSCHSIGKHPLTEHGLNDATTDEDMVRSWWARWPSANIGVPTGRTFDAVDIDGGAAAWADFVRDRGTPTHIAVVMSGRDSGGFHLYCTPGGRKTVPSGVKGLPHGVEIKAVGGYVVVPPSIHATGRSYSWVKPIEEGKVYGDIDYRIWYDTVIRDPVRAAVTSPPPIGGFDADRTARYGQAVLRRACDLMSSAQPGNRWNTLVFEAAPLVARAVDGGCLEREPAVAALEQAARAAGLDDYEAARVDELLDRMFADGITDQIRPPAEDPAISVEVWLASLPTSGEPSAIGEPEAVQDRTSWWPRDLAGVLAGTDPEPAPTMLTRVDGSALLYPGRINGLIGESESGKTWVALLSVLQVLRDGETVAYLDFEDTAAGIVSRLRLMGASDEEILRLSYFGPDESLHAAASADLSEALDLIRPGLTVLDGFNAAMTMLGLDLLSNTDATKFAQKLLRPLSRTGSCVTYVDHVPKNKEARGKGGIGAQAKRAMTTGCALSVEVAQPFGRGMTGRLRLSVDKDRPGHVRAVSGGASYAGSVVLTSDPDTGLVVVRIEAPDMRPPGGRKRWRPTGIMERVSQYLAAHPSGRSQNEIEDALGGTAAHVRAALQALFDEGYVVRPKVGLNVLVKDYSEAEDILKDEL